MVTPIIVTGSLRESAILVGGKLADLARHIPPNASHVFIITDKTVNRLYGDHFPDSATVIEIGLGEDHKTLATMESIFQALIAAGADRQAFIVGIGGGIVCDVAGFAASTYMRGIDFGFVSTTLLAQVDASVGGKNGVNLDRYKNIVGTFNQPRFVICDTEMLTTLPPDDVCCGFAEIVKHMLIADAPMLDWLESRIDQALALEPAVINRLVEHSVKIKAAVVNKDEKEAGERRKLNFGHTLGHAVEKLTGVPHGQAVALGMVAAAKLSQLRGLLTTDDVNRIVAILEKLNLPATLGATPANLLETMTHDKKREGDGVRFVLLDGIGRAVIELISFAELGRVLDQMV
ncbi:MAG: 3-dehydroquinate synthase [Lentisphaeria bacterium]|nr:3-dehydroquinate synthase [Lentisphaeria bacterium]